MDKLEKKEKSKANKIKYNIKYRLENKEKKKEYDINYREKNLEKSKEIRHKYYKNNKDKIKEYSIENKENKKIYMKIYRENNKLKIKETTKKYQKNRRQIDPLFKLKTNIRSLIRLSIINNNYTKKSKTFEILGCECKEFKQHLERQFKKGMTWENQGEWHLDHIYPVSLAKDEQELIKLNHYTNFQPMWAVENMSKGNKIIPNTQIKLI
jgi:hypothetical protein